jgi:hypothetical protein
MLFLTPGHAQADVKIRRVFVAYIGDEIPISGLHSNLNEYIGH